MGFSTTAATAIICTSLLISFNTLLTSTIPSFSDLSDSYKYLERRITERKSTDIDIVNVSATTGIPFNISIEVNNTGSITLETRDFSVVINGELRNFTAENPYLYPGNSTHLFVYNLTERKIRIKIVTGNGIEVFKVWSV